MKTTYKILIAIICRGLVSEEYSLSLNKLLLHHAKKGDTIIPHSIRTAIIWEGRDLQFFHAKENNYDYILYIDTDMVFPEDALDKLIALNKDVTAGIYYQRDYPHRANIHDFKPDGTIIHLADWPEEPFKIDTCGAGFLLIRNTVFNLFEKDKETPFEPIKNGNNQWMGEDIGFCWRCKEKNIEIWTDPSINLGHIREDIVYKGHFDCAKKMGNIPSNVVHNDDGWMADSELQWLEKTAKEFASIVELGAWKGKSTKVLLSSCNGLVYTIDHFKGSAEHIELIKYNKFIFSEFAKNVNDFNNLIVLKMDSKDAVGLFPDKSIDMIFIDSGHSYEEVKRDIELWKPKAIKLICGHDYCPGWMGVMKAVNELIDGVQFYETIWYKYL